LCQVCGAPRRTKHHGRRRQPCSPELTLKRSTVNTTSAVQAFDIPEIWTSQRFVEQLLPRSRKPHDSVHKLRMLHRPASSQRASGGDDAL
jgi:hypothetical protein